MSGAHEERVQHGNPAESECLKAYLHALPPEAWERPSACARWLVRDVVAHLVDSGAFYTASITRGLHGELTPFAGHPPAGSVNGLSAAPLTADRVLAACQHLGDAVLTAFDDTTDRFNHLVTHLPAEAAETLCYHPGNMISVRTFVGLRLLELVMHGWDIRSQFEPSAPLSPESAAVLVGFWPEFITWGLRPDSTRSTPVRCRFAFTEPMPHAYDIVVARQTVHMEPARELPAHVIFRCDAATFVFLMCGRSPLDTLITNGQVTVDGDRGLVAAFGPWFQGM